MTYKKISEGFTLIELLVVLSIISLLGSIVLASLNSARDKARISAGKQMYASLDHALGASAVGGWGFGSPGSATANDGSGLGNIGTLVGGATQLDESNCSGLLLNGCLQLNGSSGYVNIPNILTLGSDWTIAAWINTVTAGQRPVVSNRGLGGNIYFGVTAGTAFLYQNNCSPPGLNGGSLNDGKWHLYVFVRKSSPMSGEIYIDSRRVISNSPISCSTGPGGIHIGHDPPNGEYFPGLIDEVRVYTEALTAYQIQQLYAESAGRHEIVQK